MVLASASPRRAQLLQIAGIPFVVAPVEAQEPLPTVEDGAQPGQFVERLASWKASACGLEAVNLPPGETVVLAADTIVWHEGRILNKPVDAAQAREMLTELRGRSHCVFTGVCLMHGGRQWVEHEVTTVRFNFQSDAWIERYVSTGEPLDKAGAYAAQGRGAVMIDGVDGDFMNVVGLPLCRLARMLGKIGAPIEVWWDSFDVS